MSIHKCHCLFVPEHILKNLAKAGVPGARLSLLQSQQSREKRSATVVPMTTFAEIAPPGEGPRFVYDSQNTYALRVSLEREEGGPATGDDAVDDAYDYTGRARDFFKEVLNRNSYDNAGSDVISNVHVGVGFNNAIWDGDEMIFGDGDGNVFVNFTKDDDVATHELAHGVTQTTAGLIYFSQSGALNESFSDVFASVASQRHLGQDAGTADWLIGNGIMGPDLFGEALRSMKAPGTAYDNALMGTDPQPDHMDNYYAGPLDNQGVHINSGLPNKAFYLVSMDIGTDKAALIWYHALQNLWPTADFSDAVDVIVESARILTKDGQVPLGSTQSVRAAFRAVGL
jgi:Zn-dependent metalloprotease